MAAEISLLLAKLFGALYLAIGIAGLIDKDFYNKLMTDMFKNRAILFTWGVLALIMSALIIQFHSIWNGWPIILTLFGWIGLLKSFSLLIHPAGMEKFKTLFKSRFFKILPFTSLVVGALFLYAGFYG